MKFTTTFLVVLSVLSSQALAHGYLSSPPPRGIQKASYQVDDLKSPNKKGLCRGEPEGQITKVTAGQTLRLGLTITAPHIGPCRVTLLDADLTNESQPFADKYNCAAPGGPGYWDVQLPSGVSGRKVLRWYWEGQHISIPGEPYEQCIDVDFGGGSGGSGGGYQPPSAPASQQPAAGAQQPSAPAPTSEPEDQPDDEESGEESDDASDDVSDDEYGDEAPSSDNAPPTYGSTPPPPPPPQYNQAPATGSAGGCQHGAYQCSSGAGYAVCNWGTWVPMQCAPGTVCTPSGSSIVCGWA